MTRLINLRRIFAELSQEDIEVLLDSSERVADLTTRSDKLIENFLPKAQEALEQGLAKTPEQANRLKEFLQDCQKIGVITPALDKLSNDIESLMNHEQDSLEVSKKLEEVVGPSLVKINDFLNKLEGQLVELSPILNKEIDSKTQEAFQNVEEGFDELHSKNTELILTLKNWTEWTESLKIELPEDLQSSLRQISNYFEERDEELDTLHKHFYETWTRGLTENPSKSLKVLEKLLQGASQIENEISGFIKNKREDLVSDFKAIYPSLEDSEKQEIKSLVQNLFEIELEDSEIEKLEELKDSPNLGDDRKEQIDELIDSLSSEEEEKKKRGRPSKDRNISKIFTKNDREKLNKVVLKLFLEKVQEKMVKEKADKGSVTPTTQDLRNQFSSSTSSKSMLQDIDSVMQELVYDKPPTLRTLGVEESDKDKENKYLKQLENRINITIYKEVLKKLRDKNIDPFVEIYDLFQGVRTHDPKGALTEKKVLRAIVDHVYQVLLLVVKKEDRDIEGAEESFKEIEYWHDNEEKTKQKLAALISEQIKDSGREIVSGEENNWVGEENWPTLRVIADLREELGFVGSGEREEAFERSQVSQNPSSTYDVKALRREALSKLKSALSNFEAKYNSLPSDTRNMVVEEMRETTPERDTLRDVVTEFSTDPVSRTYGPIPVTRKIFLFRLFSDYQGSHIIRLLNQILEASDELFKEPKLGDLPDIGTTLSGDETIYMDGLTEAEIIDIVATYLSKSKDDLNKEFYPTKFMGELYLVPKYVYNPKLKEPLIGEFVSRMRELLDNKRRKHFEMMVDKYFQHGGYPSVEQYLSQHHRLRLPRLLRVDQLNLDETKKQALQSRQRGSLFKDENAVDPTTDEQTYENLDDETLENIGMSGDVDEELVRRGEQESEDLESELGKFLVYNYVWTYLQDNYDLSPMSVEDDMLEEINSNIDMYVRWFTENNVTSDEQATEKLEQSQLRKSLNDLYSKFYENEDKKESWNDLQDKLGNEIIPKMKEMISHSNLEEQDRKDFIKFTRSCIESIRDELTEDNYDDLHDQILEDMYEYLEKYGSDSGKDNSGLDRLRKDLIDQCNEWIDHAYPLKYENILDDKDIIDIKNVIREEVEKMDEGSVVNLTHNRVRALEKLLDEWKSNNKEDEQESSSEVTIESLLKDLLIKHYKDLGLNEKFKDSEFKTKFESELIQQIKPLVEHYIEGAKKSGLNEKSLQARPDHWRNNIDRSLNLKDFVSNLAKSVEQEANTDTSGYQEEIARLFNNIIRTKFNQYATSEKDPTIKEAINSKSQELKIVEQEIQKTATSEAMDLLKKNPTLQVSSEKGNRSATPQEYVDGYFNTKELIQYASDIYDYFKSLVSKQTQQVEAPKEENAEEASQEWDNAKPNLNQEEQNMLDNQEDYDPSKE